MLVIVNKQLTGLILLCKVFETSSQYSKCLVVLPYQWLVRNSQYKFHASFHFSHCIIVEIRIELTCETLLRPDVLSSSADGGHEQLPCTVFGVETGKT